MEPPPPTRLDCNVSLHSLTHSTADLLVPHDGNITSFTNTTSGARQTLAVSDGDTVALTLLLPSLEQSQPCVLRCARRAGSGGSSSSVSILTSVARALGVTQARTTAVLHGAVPPATAEDASSPHVADFVEFMFRDQFVSRADMWRFKLATVGQPAFIGQLLEADGVRARVAELKRLGTPRVSGILGRDTKIIFRSQSARIVWLVQMSVEMWEYAPDGMLLYEKFLRRFAEPLFFKWAALEVRHSLSVVLFARTYLDGDDAEAAARPADSLDMSMHEGATGHDGAAAAPPRAGETTSVRVDSMGRRYEDAYRMVLENDDRVDASAMALELKRALVEFPRALRWDLPGRTPAAAETGGSLEAINVTLNLLEKHYMDRDLTRTGNSIVMVTTGSGRFEVESSLAHVTKQRMMDNGIGMDVISLGVPPLHTVPLFVYASPVRPARESSDDRRFEIPHWMNLTFIDSEQPEWQHGGLPFGAALVPRLAPRNGAVDELPQAMLAVLGAPMATCGDHLGGYPLLASPPRRLSGGRRGRLSIDAADTTGGESTDDQHPPGAAAHADADGASFSRRTSSVDSRGSSGDDGGSAARPRRGTGGGYGGDGAVDSHRAAPRTGHKKWWSSCAAAERAFALISNAPPCLHMDRLDDDSDGGAGTGTGARLSFNAVQAHQLRRKRGGSTFALGTSLDDDDVEGFTYRQLQQSRRGSNAGSARGGSYGVGGVGLLGSPGVFGAEPSSFGGATARSLHHSAADGAAGPRLWPPALPDDPAHAGACAAYDGSVFGKPAAGGPGDEPAARRQHPAAAAAAAAAAAKARAAALPVPPATVGAKDPRALPPRTRRKSFDGQRRLSFDTTDPAAEATGTGAAARAAAARAVPAAVPAASNSSFSSAPRSIGGASPAASATAAVIATASGVSPTIRRRINSREARPVSSYLGNNASPSSSELSAGGGPSSLGGPLVVELAPQHASPDAIRLREVGLRSVVSSSQLASLGRHPANLRGRTATGGLLRSRSGLGGAQDGGAAVRRRRQRLNPFKRGDAVDVLKQATHSRRRWSHVFPLGVSEFHAKFHPNWKSLTTPAILPLTTDHLPRLFGTSQFRETPYSVSVGDDSDDEDGGGQDTRYTDHSALLTEMVSQRLTQDYQLVEREGSGRSGRGEGGAAAGGTKHTHVGERNQDGIIEYKLSMGHRIHTLRYDEKSSKVDVTMYCSRYGSNDDPSNRFEYAYNLWVPSTGHFHHCRQTFNKYPSPEYTWNLTDMLICGEINDLFGNMKYKRVKYVIIPPTGEGGGDAGVGTAYHDAVSSFKAHFRARGAKGDDASGKRTTGQQEQVHFRVDVGQSGEARPEWLDLAFDETVSSTRVFHIEIRWIVCAGCRVLDLVQSMYRKATSLSLRLAQVPEYAIAANLHVHPFIAQPFIAVPPALMPLANEALVGRFNFVSDHSRETDWTKMGYAPSKPKPQATPKPLVTSGNTWRRPAPTKLAPQYFHRSGAVFVRAVGNGFAWLSSRLRVSDLSLSLEAKERMSCDLMESFIDWLQVAGDLHQVWGVPLVVGGGAAAAGKEDEASPEQRARAAAIVSRVMDFVPV